MQLVGYNDEILDVKFVGKLHEHVVLATNSSQIKVLDLKTNSCQLLTGHSDTILSVDVFKDKVTFISSSKVHIFDTIIF